MRSHAIGAPRRRDQYIVGATLLVLLFSFLDFYAYEPTHEAADECRRELQFGEGGGSLFDIGFCRYDGGIGARAIAWHGFFGWFGVLMLVLAAAVPAAGLFAKSLPHGLALRWAAACAAMLGLGLLLVAALTIPEWSGWPTTSTPGLPLGPREYRSDINDSVAYGWYVAVALGGLIAVLSLFRLQQTRSHTPASLYFDARM
jgi:hypothetical protein